MAHVLPITFAGSGEKFLSRLQALPGILEYTTKQLTLLHLDAAWRRTHEVQVFEQPRQGRIPYWYDRNSDTIQLYPLLFSARPYHEVFEAFGMRHWHRNLTQADQMQWINSMVYPDHKVLEKFKDLIEEGTPYDQILSRFTDPDARLVVIHLINALKKNHVSAERAKDLDLDHYPPTADFMTAEKPYSARPLLRTFRPAHENRDSYAKAFAEFAVNRGRFLTSSPAMEKLYRGLFTAVTFS